MLSPVSCLRVSSSKLVNGFRTHFILGERGFKVIGRI
jgi:hypothetical protein